MTRVNDLLAIPTINKSILGSKLFSLAQIISEIRSEDFFNRKVLLLEKQFLRLEDKRDFFLVYTEDSIWLLVTEEHKVYLVGEGCKFPAGIYIEHSGKYAIAVGNLPMFYVESQSKEVPPL